MCKGVDRPTLFYSVTWFERPPHGSEESGLSRQVVSYHRSTNTLKHLWFSQSQHNFLRSAMSWIAFKEVKDSLTDVPDTVHCYHHCRVVCVWCHELKNGPQRWVGLVWFLLYRTTAAGLISFWKVEVCPIICLVTSGWSLMKGVSLYYFWLQPLVTGHVLQVVTLQRKASTGEHQCLKKRSFKAGGRSWQWSLKPGNLVVLCSQDHFFPPNFGLPSHIHPRTC